MALNHAAEAVDDDDDVIPGHLLLESRVCRDKKKSLSSEDGQCLCGRFRVWSGPRGTVATRGFRIGLPMNGSLVWVWGQEDG